MHSSDAPLLTGESVSFMHLGLHQYISNEQVLRSLLYITAVITGFAINIANIAILQ